MSTLRVAMVTGANRGIGAEIASQLEAGGVRVLRTSRESRSGYVQLDVVRADDIAALTRQVADEGGLDVLVNNGAVSLDGFDAETARRTLEVNFFGVMRVTDALLPSMRNGAQIIMISSGMGALSGLRGDLRSRIADPGLSRAGLLALMESFVEDVATGAHAAHGWPSNAYSVSKIGLNALVRVLHSELATDPRKIAVNAVDPGWVRTRMGGSAAPRSPEDGAHTAVWLALSPEPRPSGRLFRDERSIAW
ncbi:MAG: SDR family NAD(P)-dependent oxidoreductase [Myxococcota bacterium]|nr:SDR family NAD(P)-dependent oxidoreductase [Myxococcota bacterium]